MVVQDLLDKRNALLAKLTRLRKAIDSTVARVADMDARIATAANAPTPAPDPIAAMMAQTKQVGAAVAAYAAQTIGAIPPASTTTTTTTQ